MDNDDIVDIWVCLEIGYTTQIYLKICLNGDNC